MEPRTRYAKSGDIHIAYQVFGDAPRDLVIVPGWTSQLEVFWENPAIARIFDQIASFSRVILFDKRGTGLSDRATQLPLMEEHMDDIRAVMDAAGSEQAALVGWAEGGVISALFAATYPERTTALVLDASFARAVQGPDYPWGFTQEGLDQICLLLDQGWGDGVLLPIFAPSLVGDELARQWWARVERTSASPSVAMGVIQRLAEIDIRPVLPSISVPTLVLHRTADSVIEVEHGRYLAQHIPGAKLVELPGVDGASFVGDTDAYLGEIEEFLTGVRPAPESERVLATVLFADIASSSEKLAEIGDRRWRELLETYYAMIRRQLDRFRGREVKTIGDGFLATFDGPARAIRCAKAIAEGARSLGLDVRVGLHTGECETMGEDVTGIAVHIGSRVATEAKPGEVLVSSTVRDLVAGSGLEFADRGVHSLKGVPGTWHLFAVN